MNSWRFSSLKEAELYKGDTLTPSLSEGCGAEEACEAYFEAIGCTGDAMERTT